MKKILLIALAILLLCSCGKKKGNEKEKNPNEIVESGITYIVDQDDEAYNIKYKVASNFERRNLINCVSYYSEKIDNEYNFIIRIFKYDKKATYESVIKDLTDKKLDYEDVLVNDVEYKFAVYETDSGSGDIEIFIKKLKNEMYAFTFLAKDDINILEDVFLKGIIYNE